jgi:hypothetical protein
MISQIETPMRWQRCLAAEIQCKVRVAELKLNLGSISVFIGIRGVHSSQFGLNLGLNLGSDFDKAHPNLSF